LWIDTNISEEHAASIFRTEVYRFRKSSVTQASYTRTVALKRAILLKFSHNSTFLPENNI
jgi:hypothetical protein